MTRNRTKKNTEWRFKTIFIVGILLVIALVIATRLTGWGVSAKVFGTIEKDRIIQTDADVLHADLRDAKNAFDQDTALFIDVRSKDSFISAHIPGALSIELAEIETGADGLDKDALIITYCT